MSEHEKVTRRAALCAAAYGASIGFSLCEYSHTGEIPETNGTTDIINRVAMFLALQGFSCEESVEGLIIASNAFQLDGEGLEGVLFPDGSREAAE